MSEQRTGKATAELFEQVIHGGWVNDHETVRLRKDGANLLSAPDGLAPQAVPTAGVMQGMIEKSNVRSVVEMTRMVQVTRTYTQVASMLQQQADLRRTAIEKLAEVPNA